MIPYLLSALGGYLIGSSVESYAEGGVIEKEDIEYELRNYLKNIRIDSSWGSRGRLYKANFGTNGGISWEIIQLYFEEEGLDPDNPKYIIVQAIDRDINKDSTKEGSKGEGAKAIASLFLRYSNLEEIGYDDYSDGFWQKIGGDGDILKREDFFRYFNKKFNTDFE